MNISPQLNDDAVLQELGARITSARVAQNLTQAALAEQAGVAKRTIERLESGAVATQLSGFLRVCRVLGLLERLDALIPAPTVSPMMQLKLQTKVRQRVRAQSANVPAKMIAPKPWAWGEPS
jgi:transcriptional regulator with XRE-family HTH domain